MAKVYSIYETKSRLSEILRLVKSGKEVIVSERGCSIAKIVPYQESEDFESRIQSFIHGGQLLHKPKSTFKESSLPKNPGALKRFLEERE